MLAVNEPVTLSRLRELISEKEGRAVRGFMPSSSLPSGVPKGAISEIAGHAKIEWIAQFLRENPGINVFWIEKQFTLLPTALYQRGLCLNRYVFAEVGDEVYNTIRKALRSHAFHCVIAPNVFREEKVLKALQLLTERGNSSLLLLSKQIKPHWPICLQFEVDHADGEHNFHFKIHKNKRSNSIAPAEAL